MGELFILTHLLSSSPQCKCRARQRAKSADQTPSKHQTLVLITYAHISPFSNNYRTTAGPPGRDVGIFFVFPLWSAIAHARTGNITDALAVKSLIADFWSVYSSELLAQGRSAAFVRAAFLNAVGWAGFFSHALVTLDLHINLLQLGSEESEAKFRESAGVMALRWLRMGFGPEAEEDREISELVGSFFAVVDEEFVSEQEHADEEEEEEEGAGTTSAVTASRIAKLRQSQLSGGGRERRSSGLRLSAMKISDEALHRGEPSGAANAGKKAGVFASLSRKLDKIGRKASKLGERVFGIGEA